MPLASMASLPDASPGVSYISCVRYIDGVTDDYWDVVRCNSDCNHADAGWRRAAATRYKPQGRFQIRVSEHCFTAIRLASALGIAVIEPPRNGGMKSGHGSMGGPVGSRAGHVAGPCLRSTDAGQRGLCRFRGHHGGWVEERALLVGSAAGLWPLGLSLHSSSNYGKRVGCHCS